MKAVDTMTKRTTAPVAAPVAAYVATTDKPTIEAALAVHGWSIIGGTKYMYYVVPGPNATDGVKTVLAAHATRKTIDKQTGQPIDAAMLKATFRPALAGDAVKYAASFDTHCGHKTGAKNRFTADYNKVYSAYRDGKRDVPALFPILPAVKVSKATMTADDQTALADEL